jgi:hypothetical protein
LLIKAIYAIMIAMKDLWGDLENNKLLSDNIRKKAVNSMQKGAKDSENQNYPQENKSNIAQYDKKLRLLEEEYSKVINIQNERNNDYKSKVEKEKEAKQSQLNSKHKEIKNNQNQIKDLVEDISATKKKKLFLESQERDAESLASLGKNAVEANQLHSQKIVESQSHKVQEQNAEAASNYQEAVLQGERPDFNNGANPDNPLGQTKKERQDSLSTVKKAAESFTKSLQDIFNQWKIQNTEQSSSYTKKAEQLESKKSNLENKYINNKKEYRKASKESQSQLDQFDAKEKKERDSNIELVTGQYNRKYNELKTELQAIQLFSSDNSLSEKNFDLNNNSTIAALPDKENNNYLIKESKGEVVAPKFSLQSKGKNSYQSR